MSRKQEIYAKMLSLSVPYIRNVQTHSAITKGFNKSCYQEAELVHNLYISILEPEFTLHDINFLNHQARHYYEKAEVTKTPCFHAQCRLITELFLLVPDDMKSSLEWSGPQAL